MSTTPSLESLWDNHADGAKVEIHIPDDFRQFLIHRCSTANHIATDLPPTLLATIKSVRLGTLVELFIKHPPNLNVTCEITRQELLYLQKPELSPNESWELHAHGKASLATKTCMLN